MEDKDLFIQCPRFSGKRCVLSCAHFDRYRGCRKNCKTLEAYMKENKGIEDKVEEYYKDKPSFMPSKCSCKGLPVQEGLIKCSKCGFIAKSDRGLKKHNTTSHGR